MIFRRKLIMILIGPWILSLVGIPGTMIADFNAIARHKTYDFKRNNLLKF